MDNKRFTVGIDQIDSVVDYVYQLRNRCKIYALSGPLGAGKTTLSQKLLRKFGVQGIITSPTFTYVNRYENDKGHILYHFDLYRIETIDQFVLAGFNEYLYQTNSWAIIEWPSVIESLLDYQVCFVTIEYAGFDQRTINIKVID